MTEAEWLACDDVEQMMRGRGHFSDRQLMLFGCACCRRQWNLFTSHVPRHAVVVTEYAVDGTYGCGAADLLNARIDLEQSYPNIWWCAEFYTHLELAAYYTACDRAGAAAREAEHPLGEESGFDDYLAYLKCEVAAQVCSAMTRPHELEAEFAHDAAARVGVHLEVGWDGFERVWRAESAAQCSLLRDIAGNPFRPVTLSPTWLTPAVVSLAQSIYDERAFDRMPELADELERAGCDDADVMSHCRNGGAHVRGCWVVDLVLGKS